MSMISRENESAPTLKELAERAAAKLAEESAAPCASGALAEQSTGEAAGAESVESVEQTFLISLNAAGLSLLTNALYHGSIPAEQLYAEHGDLARAIDLADSAMPDPVSDPVPDPSPDLINHPPHYGGHPSGVECIDITEHMNFCLGNAVKYIWRAGLKDDATADLEKARWYIRREIARLAAA